MTSRLEVFNPVTIEDKCSQLTKEELKVLYFTTLCLEKEEAPKGEDRKDVKPKYTTQAIKYFLGFATGILSCKDYKSKLKSGLVHLQYQAAALAYLVDSALGQNFGTTGNRQKMLEAMQLASKENTNLQKLLAIINATGKQPGDLIKLAKLVEKVLLAKAGHSRNNSGSKDAEDIKSFDFSPAEDEKDDEEDGLEMLSLNKTDLAKCT